ncbi:acyl-CoA dehydrogenase family protein [Streptomyces sp. NPDC001941]|uniref:acyl-CoA dehydrogenase family protein n=1 Tax=Streptomyces sp. NPDC001941 TaxID=3154659 RepID=UPI00331748D7
MRFALTDEHRELARTTHRLLTSRRGDFPPAFGAAPRLDRRLWRDLADLGLLAPAVPEKLGGTGAGLLEAAVVTEQAGAAPAPVPYLPLAVAAELLVEAEAHGGGDTAAALLAGVTDGSLVAVPAWETYPAPVVTRPGADALSLAGGRVSGRLKAVPFGDEADVLLAFAAGSLVVVRLDGPGVECAPRDGLDVMERVASVRLDAVEPELVVRIPFGDRVLSALWTYHAAELVGLAQQALDSASAYARERHQFGRPIGSFQAVKHTLADRHAEVDSARLLVHWAAATGDPHAARVAVQSAGDAADAATGDNLQVHGGMGFTWEGTAHVLLKRARARRALLGTSDRQLDAIADRVLNHRSVLTPRSRGER